MNPHLTSRLAAAVLIALLPTAACFAETQPPTADDLTAVSERIRQTGEQVRTDIKEARARLEAQKLRQEADRKREAEQAQRQASKDAAEQAQARRDAALQAGRKQQAAEASAARAKETKQAAVEPPVAVSPKLSAQDEALLARGKAAKALLDARKSSGAETFAEIGL